MRRDEELSGRKDLAGGKGAEQDPERDDNNSRARMTRVGIRGQARTGKGGIERRFAQLK